MIHVLNFGMGVESCALLVLWLLFPQIRGFPLEDLHVLTAQTGDEYHSTKVLIEQYILPLLRRYKVRWIQIARAGPLKSAGYTVLSDTRTSWECHIEGDYKLSEEMLVGGTVVEFGGAGHKCAFKAKGTVIDAWLTDHMKEIAIGPYLGYNASEVSRKEKSQRYGCLGFEYRYPLIDLGWTREDCLAFLRWVFGVEFEKSCCKGCPFQELSGVRERWRREPAEAGEALYMEALALALNPRMQLFSKCSGYDLAKQSQNYAALADLERRLNAAEWAIYRVERIYEQGISQKSGKPFTRVKRRLRVVERGDRAAMSQRLHVLAFEKGLQVEEMQRVERVVSHERQKGVYPSREAFWVACPMVAQDKVQNAKWFQKRWMEIDFMETDV